MRVTVNPNTLRETVTNVSYDTVEKTNVKTFSALTFTPSEMYPCKNDENKTLIFRQLDDVQLVEIYDNSDFTVKG